MFKWILVVTLTVFTTSLIADEPEKQKADPGAEGAKTTEKKKDEPAAGSAADPLGTLFGKEHDTDEKRLKELGTPKGAHDLAKYLQKAFATGTFEDEKAKEALLPLLKKMSKSDNDPFARAYRLVEQGCLS